MSNPVETIVETTLAPTSHDVKILRHIEEDALPTDRALAVVGAAGGPDDDGVARALVGSGLTRKGCAKAAAKEYQTLLRAALVRAGANYSHERKK